MYINNSNYKITQIWNRIHPNPDGGYKGSVSTPLGLVLVQQRSYKGETGSWSNIVLIAMKGNRQYIRQIYNFKNQYTIRGLSIIAHKFIKEI